MGRGRGLRQPFTAPAKGGGTSAGRGRGLGQPFTAPAERGGASSGSGLGDGPRPLRLRRARAVRALPSVGRLLSGLCCRRRPPSPRTRPRPARAPRPAPAARPSRPGRAAACSSSSSTRGGGGGGSERGGAPGGGGAACGPRAGRSCPSVQSRPHAAPRRLCCRAPVAAPADAQMVDAGGRPGGDGWRRMEAAPDGAVDVVPLDRYDPARAKIAANLQWLCAKAYGRGGRRGADGAPRSGRRGRGALRGARVRAPGPPSPPQTLAARRVIGGRGRVCGSGPSPGEPPVSLGDPSSGARPQASRWFPRIRWFPRPPGPGFLIHFRGFVSTGA